MVERLLHRAPRAPEESELERPELGKGGAPTTVPLRLCVDCADAVGSIGGALWSLASQHLGISVQVRAAWW